MCRCADEKNMADDGNLLFQGETKMGVFCIGTIFSMPFCTCFDGRLIAFRKRIVGIL